MIKTTDSNKKAKKVESNSALQTPLPLSATHLGQQPTQPEEKQTLQADSKSNASSIPTTPPPKKRRTQPPSIKETKRAAKEYFQQYGYQPYFLTSITPEPQTRQSDQDTEAQSIKTPSMRSQYSDKV